MRGVLSLALVLLCVNPRVWAEQSDDTAALRAQVEELTKTVQSLTQTVQTQQTRIQALEAKNTDGNEPSNVSAAALPSQSPGAPRSSGKSQSRAALNPEIGVSADIVGQFSERSLDTEGNDKISAREVELSFGHPIDPYSRLDVTAAFSDFEEAELEEAYITHWGLPAELNARLGRFRPKVGKATAVHRDALDTVDEPLVVSQYLGAEGLFRTGAEVVGFVPTPWTTVTHELAIGVMEGGVGEGGALFGTTRRRPSWYGHLKNFVDVADATSAELGMTYLTGSSDDDAKYEVHTLGLDATLIHYVGASNPLKWQSELYLQDRAEAGDALNHPWGGYSLLDYRATPRIGIGGRIDYVEPIGLGGLSRVRSGDTALSSYLTLYQSEWARWRLQYRHTDFAAGGDDNTVFLQGTFSIGVHKHALQ